MIRRWLTPRTTKSRGNQGITITLYLIKQITRLFFSWLRELVRREFEKRLDKSKTLNYYLYGKTSYIRRDYLNTYKVTLFKVNRLESTNELDLNNVEYNSYLLSEEESINDESGKA
jgi:hypothetical protein